MERDSREQITIDGPAASGKSTVAKLLAAELDAFYINTGEMYRALTWEALKQQINPQSDQDKITTLLKTTNLSLIKAPDEEKKINLFINNQPVDVSAIRSPEVTENVSFTAKIPSVRQWMLDRQRNTESLGLIVVEGRDIGTVVFPNARYKFYLVATPEERARRRLAQSGEVSDGATIKMVTAEIVERDRIDSTREIAPLKPASDAAIVDTTNQSVNSIVSKLASIVREIRQTTNFSPSSIVRS